MTLRRLDLLLGALVLVVAVFAISMSWDRWLEPIIDSGRDLYVPEQLREGTRLYRDILYYYPPLTPYLLAAITAITGSSLRAYAWIGIAIAVLTALALWLAARRVAGPIAAAVTGVLFFAFNFASVGWGSNYVHPWAHAATLGMLFFLGAVACFLGSSVGAAGPAAQAGEPPASTQRQQALGTFLCFLSAWTKVEFALFATLLVVFVVLVRRMHVRWLAAYAAAGVASIAAAAAYFGIDHLRANILPPALLGGAATKHFYLQVTGFADWQHNLAASARGALLVAGLVAALAFAKRARPLIFIAALLVALLATGDAFFRAWTILQLALIPFALRRPREPLALLLLVSLCASSRIYLSLTPQWYGIVFTLPLYLVIVYVLFEWLPSREVYSRREALLFLPLLAILAIGSLRTQFEAYSAKTHAVVSTRGTFYEYSAERAAMFNALLDERASSMVVIPEGLALNWLARIETPVRWYTFTPAETADAAVEEEILRELAAHPPELIAFVPRDMTEFGSRGFGVDYNQRVMAWIRAHHGVARQVGRLTVLRRR